MSQNNFNPLSLYRERRDMPWDNKKEVGISIHSPYTGRDSTSFATPLPARNFNPLSLYRERPERVLDDMEGWIFQSTLPIQGETDAIIKKRTYFRISIHSPYTGRDDSYRYLAHPTGISIHSPYTGRDTLQLFPISDGLAFQSTLPIQGETDLGGKAMASIDISIHSPYTGRDGGRAAGTGSEKFQSTLPIQGETDRGIRWKYGTIYFNPLSLYRERPCRRW